MSNAVKAIIEQIDALADKDRVELERELSQRQDRYWKAEVARARRIARRRGITQAKIDQAIERRRYAK